MMREIIMRKIIFLTILSACLVGFAWERSALAAGAKENYKWYCTQCHGKGGKGDGMNAKPGLMGFKQPEMSVSPRNHTSPKDMNKLTDDDLRTAITDGGASVSKSALMPPFGKTLSEAEIADLVKYLRKLCKCKGK